jgi:hypothetical protein
MISSSISSSRCVISLSTLSLIIIYVVAKQYTLERMVFTLAATTNGVWGDGTSLIIINMLSSNNQQNRRNHLTGYWTCFRSFEKMRYCTSNNGLAAMRKILYVGYQHHKSTLVDWDNHQMRETMTCRTYSSTVQYCKVQYSTSYSTVQYCTVVKRSLTEATFRASSAGEIPNLWQVMQ